MLGFFLSFFVCTRTSIVAINLSYKWAVNGLMTAKESVYLKKNKKKDEKS